MSLAQGWGVLARLRRAAASLLVAAGVAAWPAARPPTPASRR